MSQGLKISLALVFLIIYSSICVAQKLKRSTEKLNWATTSLAGNGVHSRASGENKYTTHIDDPYDLASGEFNNYVLKVSATERIIPVKLKKQWGIVRVNNDGKIIWEFQRDAEEHMIGIGMMGNDVILILGDYQKKITTAKAVLVNGATGAIIRDRIVFEFSETDYFKFRMQNDENGVFKNLLVISHEKKGTPSIQSVNIDAQLMNSPTVTLRPTYTPVKFAGSLISKSGEIVLADFSEDQLTIAKFGKDGKELKKISIPIERKSDRFQSVIQFDISNPEAIIIALKYSPTKKDWATRILRFDLKTGKVTSSPVEPLEKTHAENYKLVDVKGVSDGNVKWIEDAVIAGLVQWQDKIVIISEIRTSVTKQVSNNRIDIDYTNHALMLSVYDVALKLKGTTGIKKRYHSNLPSSLTAGFHVYNNKLIVLSSASTGLTSSEVIVVTLNLDTEQMEPVKLASDLKRSGFSACELNATLWFDDSFLVQELKMGKGMFNPPLNCVLHKMVM